eukprot:SAG31_NODE_286_length_18467_cov_41.317056_8_plen_80_part_00
MVDLQHGVRGVSYALNLFSRQPILTNCLLARTLAPCVYRAAAKNSAEHCINCVLVALEMLIRFVIYYGTPRAAPLLYSI